MVSKYAQISNLIEIRPVGAELFLAKLIVAFRNFTKAPKNKQFSFCNADLTENIRRGMYFALLPICTVATATKTVYKYCGIFCML